MTFIQALFLLGAFAVAGPIAAHFLARPRFRRVPFTMLRFLRAGEVQSQSRRRLRNLLILLLRCAIVLLIAIFFAGPEQILAERKAETRPVAIVGLDDSLSMAYGDVFGRAVAAAGDLIRSAAPNARFHVIGLASGESLRDVDAAAALQFAAGLQPVPLKMKAAPLLSAVESATRTGDGPVSVGLVSDFTPEARAAFDGIAVPMPVDSFSFAHVTSDPPAANLAITDVQVVLGGDERLALSVAVANSGSSGVEATVSGMLDGGPPAVAPFRIEGHARTSVPLSIPLVASEALFSRVELALEPGDGLPQDGHYYVGLTRAGGHARNVLILAEDAAGAFLVKTALQTIAQVNPLNPMAVQVVTHNTFKPELLASVQVVVLASAPRGRASGMDALADFVRAGGRLVAFVGGGGPDYYKALAEAGILPAVPVELQRKPVHLAARMSDPALGGVLSPEGDAFRALHNYRLESLPVSGAYALSLSQDAEVLWAFEGGDPFLCYQAAGRGTALLVNTSADDSLSPLMKSAGAVAFASYLVGGIAQLEPYAYEAGETVYLPASEFELAHSEDGEAVYVAAPGGANLSAYRTGPSLAVPRVPELGWVSTLSKPVRYAGVNVPRGETDLTPAPDAAVEALLAGVFQEDPDIAVDGAPGGQERKSLWRGVAWAALGLLLLDVFVSNRVNR